MLLKPFTIVAASLFPVLVLPAQAGTTEIGGVDVPEAVTLNDTELALSGGGQRSKWFMNVYVASLYLSEPTTDAQTVIEEDRAKAITLHITSGMINRDRMVDSVEEGFERAMEGKTEPVQEHIDELVTAFGDEIDKGDLVGLYYMPGEGVTVRHNGDVVGEIEGDETFKQALFAIWLGDEPAAHDLKEAMLGL